MFGRVSKSDREIIERTEQFEADREQSTRMSKEELAQRRVQRDEEHQELQDKFDQLTGVTFEHKEYINSLTQQQKNELFKHQVRQDRLWLPLDGALWLIKLPFRIAWWSIKAPFRILWWIVRH